MLSSGHLHLPHRVPGSGRPRKSCLEDLCILLSSKAVTPDYSFTPIEMFLKHLIRVIIKWRIPDVSSCMPACDSHFASWLQNCSEVCGAGGSSPEAPPLGHRGCAHTRGPRLQAWRVTAAGWGRFGHSCLLPVRLTWQSSGRCSSLPAATQAAVL